ncbi:putative bifunctional diguanylate cyclase/phosphodiesterase [Hansschlegelia sp.]|uniref:putative bifunctional diguanylate cyclase/phosphodiesterase n=1 Tax=Hansschlegelia sp. TaxID=2041892 RepID=UPI002B9DB410|nr:EAL domain-containing protein [Hansschlegelia sp.]HVI28656.1 EAL domain-containing protein [Hansschlegelia sp.]
MSAPGRLKRVVVADDEEQVILAYQRVFEPLLAKSAAGDASFDELSAELFGDAPKTASAAPTLDEVIYCRQGEAVVETVAAGLHGGRPISVVFLDMRMPPGIDGLETARRIRATDPDVTIVVVTGYSDHKPGTIADALGIPGRLFYLTKPFDPDELRQIAAALTDRWVSERAAADELSQRVAELERLNLELAASESRARQAVLLDALTGLSNRNGLSERFCANGPDGSGGPTVSTLYLDLDNFKDVNDSLGHIVGDELIQAFAARLAEQTGEDGFAARLGGDEFAVICTDPNRAHRLAERLIDACSRPYDLKSHRIRVGVSIGIAHSAQCQLLEAMRRADIALYAAKSAGGGVWREFEPSMERDIVGDQTLANELVEALANDQLSLHYQPVVAVDGHRIEAVEALLRWRHPTRGMIPPLVFIPIAERSNLIHELGEWVIRRAFWDAREWPDITTAINLSPVQLRAPGFVERIHGLALEAGVDPRAVELEITETTLIRDVDEAADQMRSLMAHGFRIALDDFGSGFASLAYLTQIPFTKLKIDRSLVNDLQSKPGADQVVRAIIGLGKALGLSITAEGVEHADQLSVLTSAGCSYMQGFLFHRPLTREELQTLRGRPEVSKAATKVA